VTSDFQSSATRWRDGLIFGALLLAGAGLAVILSRVPRPRDTPALRGALVAAGVLALIAVVAVGVLKAGSFTGSGSVSNSSSRFTSGSSNFRTVWWQQALDGWQHHKGPRSAAPLEADPVKFPHGIRWLADYAHAHGFKLGIYSGPGQTTCAGYTGSEGHEREDAAMFASWGIDHLKYDSCCSHKDAPEAEVQRVVGLMGQALRAQAPRQAIVYHACHCGWATVS